MLRTFILFLIFIGIITCAEPKKEPTLRDKRIAELREKSNAIGPEEMGFKLDGVPFVFNKEHYSDERPVRDNSGRRAMRLFLVQNDYKQSLDMLFPVPDADSLPQTFQFVDKYKQDPATLNYAVCLFGSYDKQGRHEIPASRSTITITAWDPSTRVMSGSFELHIQNAENRNDVIDITEGYFKNLSFERR